MTPLDLRGVNLDQLRRDVRGFAGHFEYQAEDEWLAEPVARMLNAVPQLLALVDELQRARDEACRLLEKHAPEGSYGRQAAGQLRAIGQRAEGGSNE